MRLGLCLLALAPLAFPQHDVDQLLQRAVEAAIHNAQQIGDYTWRTERVLWRIDKKGVRTKHSTQVWETTRTGWSASCTFDTPPGTTCAGMG